VLDFYKGKAKRPERIKEEDEESPDKAEVIAQKKGIKPVVIQPRSTS